MNGRERDLLASITQRMESVSDQRHALARQHGTLQSAATQIRTGKPAAIVSAELHEAGIYLCPQAIDQLNELGEREG